MHFWKNSPNPYAKTLQLMAWHLLRCQWITVNSKESFCIDEALDLSLALIAAGLEESIFHPLAICANAFRCIVFRILVISQLVLVLVVLGHFLLKVGLLCFGVSLRLFLTIESRLQCSVLLQVLLLCISIISAAFFELLFSVFDKHLKNGDDATCLALAAVSTCKGCVWRFVWILFILRSFLDEPEGDLVLLVVLTQCNDCLLQQTSCICVVFCCLTELTLFLIAELQELSHVFLGSFDISLQSANFTLKVLLCVSHALQSCLGLLDAALKVGQLILVGILTILATITVFNVVLLLLAKNTDHVINHSDDLVKMTAR